MILTEQDARGYAAARLSPAQMARLEDFVSALVDENLRQNLVSPRTLDAIWQRHLVDSLQLVRFFEGASKGTGLDLGSGAGFPGIILAIACSDMEWALVESRRLRIEWLERVSSDLGLRNVAVIGQNLSVVPPFPAAVITARAFAPLERLLRLAAPFSTKETFWVLPKGSSAEHELTELPYAERRMFHVEHSISDPAAGIIIGRGRLGIKT